MRFSAANLVITAETRNTRSARGPLVGGAACGSLTGGRLDDSVRRGSLPTNGLAFSHSAGGSRRTLWRFRTVRAAPDGILGRPHRADRFPTKFWAVRAERIASRRDFGPSAQCGRLPTDALAFPHSAGGSPTAFWRFRTVRAAPDGRFGVSAQCGRLPDGVLAFPHSAGGSRRTLWRFRTVRAAPRRTVWGMGLASSLRFLCSA